MKTITINTDSSNCTIKISKPAASKEVHLEVCCSSVKVGLYKLYRLKGAIDAAIKEIESEVKK